MKLIITDQKTGGDLLLISGEQDFDRLFYTRDKEKKYFTIAWNHGEKQTATIDGVANDAGSRHMVFCLPVIAAILRRPIFS